MDLLGSLLLVIIFVAIIDYIGGYLESLWAKPDQNESTYTPPRDIEEKGRELTQQQSTYAASKHKNSTNWLIIKEEVFEKYGRKCVNCGTTENIDVHHKIPLSEGGTNSLENLVPLCRNCHEELHRFKFEPLEPQTRIDNQYGSKISKDKTSMIGYKICSAIENRYRIKIKYKSGEKEITERIVYPYEIKLGCECENDMVHNSKYDQDKKFLRAYCELRHEERLFRLDRIIDVTEEL